MKHFTFMLMLLCAVPGAVSLSAGTANLGDRVGRIVAAEYSSTPVEIGDRASSAVPERLPEEHYILITLKMTPRRSVSLVDYTLRINGVTVPCFAVTRNGGLFVPSPEAVSLFENDTARLLFIVDGTRIKPVNGTLRAVLQPVLRGRAPVTFTITDIGDRKFTEPARIPAAGLLP